MIPAPSLLLNLITSGIIGQYIFSITTKYFFLNFYTCFTSLFYLINKKLDHLLKQYYDILFLPMSFVLFLSYMGLFCYH